MFRSVRGRLILSYVLFSLFTVALLGVVSFSLIQRSMEAQEIALLKNNAEGIALEAAARIWPFPRPAELQEIAESAAFLSGTRVKIFNPDRTLIADSGNPAKFDQFVFFFLPFDIPFGTREDLGTLIMRFPRENSRRQAEILESPRATFDLLERFPSETRYTVIERIAEPWGGRVIFETQPSIDAKSATVRSSRTITVPINSGDRTLGYVELSEGPDLIQNTLGTVKRAFLLAAGGVLFLAGLMGFLVARRLTSPLQSLAEAARQMGDGDLSIRAPEDQTAEIGAVAGQFNRMAERLETSFSELAGERDTLRRFTADASHELRTPITALKNFLELLAGPAEGDRDVRQEFILESQRQVNRLEWITDNLLNLSRLEGGLAGLEFNACDLGELLDETVKIHAPMAREKEIHLEIADQQTEVGLVCDRSWMLTAVSNLVDNAIKFSDFGGQIELGGRKADGQIELWVKDSGLGIDPDEVDLIFDRFYRGKGHQNMGSGLGLAIVRRVAEAHDARIEVHSAPGAGTKFTLFFPESQD